MNNVANTHLHKLSGQSHTLSDRISLQYETGMKIKNGFLRNRLLAVKLIKYLSLNIRSAFFGFVICIALFDLSYRQSSTSAFQ